MKKCKHVYITIDKIIFQNRQQLELTVTGSDVKQYAFNDYACDYKIKGIFADDILIEFLETVDCERIYISEIDFSYLNNRVQYLMKDSVVMEEIKNVR